LGIHFLGRDGRHNSLKFYHIPCSAIGIENSVLTTTMFHLIYSVMEQSGAPIEHVHEELHHHAKQSRQRWVKYVALSSSLLAFLAALAGLSAGYHVNEAMLEQIRSADQWGYYQAKGIKGGIIKAKLDILGSLNRPISKEDRQQMERYKSEQEDIKRTAEEKDQSSQRHLNMHFKLSSALTLFQISIVIGAVAVLIGQPSFWYFSLVFGFAGIYFLVQGFRG
jgi:hypothetical protein